MVSTQPELFATDDLRWEALTTRDRRAEGAFLYAVSTTGVYCRPTCASRLPNRQNVRFFADRTEAERAGYRACKRCRPDAGSDRPGYSDAITQACRLMDETEERLTLKQLADAVGLSPFHFHRVFKAMVGVTPAEYGAARRRGRLQGELLEGGPVTLAIYDAGFGSSSRVYESTANLLGMTPSRYQRGAVGLPIRFAVAQTSLGWVLVAATERGICMIELGDTPEVLTARMRDRFPEAALHSDDPDFAAWVAEIVALLDEPGRRLDLPLDIRGTAFQQRVWKSLQEIPVGTTASYAEVAGRIGRPTAARAVARACASNPLAVAIPCHRVVGSDGDLTGYRWGIERKRALLARERAAGDAEDPKRSTSDVTGASASGVVAEPGGRAPDPVPRHEDRSGRISSRSYGIHADTRDIGAESALDDEAESDAVAVSAGEEDRSVSDVVLQVFEEIARVLLNEACVSRLCLTQ